ncbi:hypothetical protein SEA_SKOG_90 [Gordonia phage Skog]|uniref:Uncharacterized protein n=1 Tax=Gordonia phage Skog TaxID=2704033 RepID=A0A6G6XJG6_9CAUD|nr:hypothetical protein KHQ85_gp090 [Gordonia phage Skog]QIG58242.1 hypothetical protein SEA_SKOG_90 [Gordonia phage Skog]
MSDYIDPLVKQAEQVILRHQRGSGVPTQEWVHLVQSLARRVDDLTHKGGIR